MLDVLTEGGEVPTLFEKSVRGRRGVMLSESTLEVAAVQDLLDPAVVREQLLLPEVAESEAVRHWLRLAHRNWAIDLGFYPLGSCTMKYNPKIHEELAAAEGWRDLHPLQRDEEVQGILELLWRTQAMLAEIGGMDQVSLLPAAGAQGEMAGLLMVRRYYEERGEVGRRIIVVPDSSHGTNPATAARMGYRVVTLRSNAEGRVDREALRSVLSAEVAAVMLTNPNTLGLFETEIEAISAMVHEAGALLYCDGANLNAILGIARPGDMGFDVMHFNLHKTFSTPHGGGGPGAGAVGVQRILEPYLPVPLVIQEGDRFRMDWARPRSIGCIHSFWGNVGVVIRAYAYLLSLGAEGLREVAQMAVLNANYIASQLGGVYELPYGRRCLHECVVSGRRFREHGVRTLDVAKRLIDHGIHPPTIYFPLIVEDALMIEPTETESKEHLDAFLAALSEIAQELETCPEVLRAAPERGVVGRVDEAEAARRCDLGWGCRA